MDLINLDNPAFHAWAVASALLVLKVMAQGWVTVWLMMREGGGYAAPEDLRQTRLNPDPDPKQLRPNETVERSRRMHRNDLENIPAFWIAGLLFVLAAPPVWVAQGLLYGYVVSRAAHAWAYGTAQTHDVRATFWTIGSVMVIVMAVWSLVAFLA